jgi:hypothetical protein
VELLLLIITEDALIWPLSFHDRCEKITFLKVRAQDESGMKAAEH